VGEWEIEAGEDQQLDFKCCVSDSRKIARTLSAFSNSDGGRLLRTIRMASGGPDKLHTFFHYI